MKHKKKHMLCDSYTLNRFVRYQKKHVVPLHGRLEPVSSGHERANRSHNGARNKNNERLYLFVVAGVSARFNDLARIWCYSKRLGVSIYFFANSNYTFYRQIQIYMIFDVIKMMLAAYKVEKIHFLKT